MLNMNKMRAIAEAAMVRMVNNYAPEDEFAGYVAGVTETVIGFGTTALTAVANGLGNNTIQCPESDQPLTANDVLEILKHGGIVTFYNTRHGVLITDEN
jgi:hypothetical protein